MMFSANVRVQHHFPLLHMQAIPYSSEEMCLTSQGWTNDCMDEDGLIIYTQNTFFYPGGGGGIHMVYIITEYASLHNECFTQGFQI